MSAKRRDLGVVVTERNVVIVGPSGSGKSETINALTSYCDNPVREARVAPKSVTKEAIVPYDPVRISNDNKEFVLRLFDTRGLTDSTSTFHNMIPQWNELVKKELHRLHFVVFVIPVDRMSKGLLQEVALMTSFLEKWGMKQHNGLVSFFLVFFLVLPSHILFSFFFLVVLLVVNKCDFFKAEVIDSFVEEFLSDPELCLPDLVKKATILKTAFLNKSLLIPSVHTLAEEKLVASTNDLLDHLLTNAPVEPFNPREAVVAEELAKAERERKAAEARIQTHRHKGCHVM